MDFLNYDSTWRRKQDQFHRAAEAARVQHAAVTALSRLRTNSASSGRPTNLICTCHVKYSETQCHVHPAHSMLSSHSAGLDWEFLSHIRALRNPSDCIRRIHDAVSVQHRRANGRNHQGQLYRWTWHINHQARIIDGRLLLQVQSTLEMQETPEMRHLNQWWPDLEASVFSNVGCIHVASSPEFIANLGARVVDLGYQRSWTAFARKRLARPYQYLQHAATCLCCNTEVYTEVRRTSMNRKQTFSGMKRSFMLYQYFDLGDKADAVQWSSLVQRDDRVRARTVLNLHTLFLAASGKKPRRRDRHGEEEFQRRGSNGCYVEQTGWTKNRQVSLRSRFTRAFIEPRPVDQRPSPAHQAVGACQPLPPPPYAEKSS